MRAHIAKDVKAKCISKKIDMMVIPGGLTPYLQAGDIGIFKSFKDCLLSVIDDWKRYRSGAVHQERISVATERGGGGDVGQQFR